jgi:hypothetical protein
LENLSPAAVAATTSAEVTSAAEPADVAAAKRVAATAERLAATEPARRAGRRKAARRSAEAWAAEAAVGLTGEIAAVLNLRHIPAAKALAREIAAHIGSVGHCSGETAIDHSGLA